MKKINIVRSWLIGSFVLFGITSCTAGFEDANRPGHETSLTRRLCGFLFYHRVAELCFS